MASSSTSDWQEKIVKRARTDEKRVGEILVAHRIHPSPVTASPRRLMIKRIAFSGVKDGVPDSGPFDFVWDNLDRGLWAMVTDGNLKGKSSVIEVVRWLLRGRPSDNLQEDVKRWIHHASLQFQLDENIYEIRAEAGMDVKGNLLRLESRGSEWELASFTRDGEFEAVMSDFFMREFALETITSWYSGTGEDGGRAVLHGWPSLSGVMFIGTDYSSLLGDIPPASGLPIRLMQMYLGLPWISTLTAAKAAQHSVSRDQQAKERLRSVGLAAKKARVEVIKSELDAKKEELARTPSDHDLHVTMTMISRELADNKNIERDIEERLARAKQAISQAEIAYAEDRRELQAYLDAEAAGAIFRMLDPSCCPRCDAEIDEERRKKEVTTHSCSVCGEGLASNTEPEVIQTALEARVQASKAALGKAKHDQEVAYEELDKVQRRIVVLDDEFSSLTVKLASFGARTRLEVEVAVLEARMAEAGYDIGSEEPTDDEVPILDALVTETENRVKSVQTDLLKTVSERLASYAKRFGMEALSAAELRGNMNLLLVKGGQNTSYSKVTEGEKLRLKVATVLAMISVAEEQGIGRHPGLLMIDSPGAQEVSPKDLEELIAGLEEVSKEFAHLQVFVAALASRAITRHVSPERTRQAKGEAPLW